MSNKLFTKWLDLCINLDRCRCLARTGKPEYVKACRWAERRLEAIEREMVS